MKKNTAFDKFMSKEKKGAAKKEQIRQDKRKWKKDQQERFKAKDAGHRGQDPRYKSSRPGKGEGAAQEARNRPAPRSFNEGRGERVQKPRTVDKVGKPKLHLKKDDREENFKKKPSIIVKPVRTGDGREEPVEKQQRANDSKGPKLQLKRGDRKVGLEKSKDQKPQASSKETSGQASHMPLNKYIAHCGICSRRDAVEIIKGGKVKVNGELIVEPGHKVFANDEVKLAGKKIHPVRDMVYILLNKQKDYLTTTDDPQQRKTVLDLIRNATSDRVYPVGRLDRNTSGVLLLTNDGDLSQKLTHPSNEIRKVYAVTLDKPLTRHHFEEILKGVPLDDGVAHVDSLAFTDARDHTQIGVELHTGRNRIVRRIFEHYGYDVKNLDRVIFAGLTKKNVTRGKWRYLNEKEVRDLKFFKKGKR